MSGETAKHELSVSVTINAPTRRVWQIMTERIGEWWAPKPWTTDVERFDPWPGGSSMIVMRGPNGEEFRTPGFILRWEPGYRFVMTDAIDGELYPNGPFMIGIWAVEPDGDESRFTASARHWTAEAMKEHEEMGFETGWKVVANQLKELCEE